MSVRARSTKALSTSCFAPDVIAETRVPASHRCWRNFAAARRSYAPLASCPLRSVGTGNLHRQFEQPHPFTSFSIQINERSTLATQCNIVTNNIICAKLVGNHSCSKRGYSALYQQKVYGHQNQEQAVDPEYDGSGKHRNEPSRQQVSHRHPPPECTVVDTHHTSTHFVGRNQLHER